MLRPVPSTFDVVKERTPSFSHPIILHLAPFAITPMQEIKLDIIYTCKNDCIRKYTSDRVGGSKTIIIAESNQWSGTLKVNVVRVTDGTTND